MDEFLVPGANYVRLRNEWHKYGSLTIGYDFDNTVFDFHNTGTSYEMVRDLLREAKEIGCKLICWTAQKDLNFVTTFLQENNIPFDGINEGAIDLGWETKKPFFSILLDDRCGLSSAYYDLKTLVNYVKFTKQ